MWPRVVLLVALVAGCAKQGIELPAWTLASGDARTAVTLPAPLRDELPRTELDYTLTTAVSLDLDLRGHALGLVVECFHGELAARANGTALVPDIGGADGSWRFAVPAELTRGPSLTLVLSVHRDAQANLGFGTVPRLTDSPRGDARSRGIATFNRYAAIAALCFLGLLVVLYATLALLERRAVYATVVAYGVTAAGTPLLILGVFHDVFGASGLLIAMMIGALAFLSALYFIQYALELPPMPRAWPAGIIAFAVLSPVSLLSLTATQVTTAAFMLLMLVTFVYGAHRIYQVARDPEHAIDARLMLAAYGLAIIILSHTIHYGLTGRNSLGGLHPMSIAIAFQAAVQALILARQHVARQRALETTNTELQRQIAERSRELGDALSRLGTRTQPLAAGRTIDGRYRVLEELGSGGMGAVFSVERLSDGKKLALKTIKGHTAPDLMARFAREAQVAAELDHPNLVRVLDVGIAEGGLYLVMPLVEGGSLEGQRARFGDRAWAAPLVRQMASGLAALHARDIIHRDLKPANVLVADGIAQIADFGLAALAAADVAPTEPAVAPTLPAPAATERTMTGVLNRKAEPRRDDALTRIGDLFGTPPYMAPELAVGVHAVKPSSDVFALGLIAYELYTGKKAFAEPPLVLRMSGQPIPSPDVTGIPPAIARCLALDPAARPTAAELAEALA